MVSSITSNGNYQLSITSLGTRLHLPSWLPKECSSISGNSWDIKQNSTPFFLTAGLLKHHTTLCWSNSVPNISKINIIKLITPLLTILCQLFTVQTFMTRSNTQHTMPQDQWYRPWLPHPSHQSFISSQLCALLKLNFFMFPNEL